MEKLDALRASDAANLDLACLSTQMIAHQQTFEMFEAYQRDGPETVP